MAESNCVDKASLLYPRSRYYGDFKPEYLAFNANLQEFAQKVSYVCAFQTGGSISAEEAYEDLRRLWENLKQTKQSLGIGTTSSRGES